MNWRRHSAPLLHLNSKSVYKYLRNYSDDPQQEANVRITTLFIAGLGILIVIAILWLRVPTVSVAATLGPVVPRRPDSRATLAILQSTDEIMPSGNPVEMAAKAIAQRDFRLIASGSFPGDNSRPAGVTCFTPNGVAPGIRARHTYGDVITKEVIQRTQYAAHFNQHIVADKNYPFADICRPSYAGDITSQDSPLVDRSAGKTARPVATLHEAARRGSAADVRRFLATSPRNMLDEVGMTPLAWATARGRSDIYDLLIFNGEVPRAIADSSGRDDLYWAIATGRKALVDIGLGVEPSRGMLRSIFLEAALASGSVEITESVLAAPHEPLRKGMLRPKNWNAATVEALLKASGNETAQELLETSCDTYGEIRNDLIRLALRYGANPNVAPDMQVGRYKTPLYAVTMSYGPSATDAMSILLTAQADPNVASLDPPVAPKLPLWAIADRLIWTDDVQFRHELGIRVELR